MQGVRGVLTSPTTVRDEDGGKGSKSQCAVLAARECGVQQHVAVNKRSSTAATVSLQWSRALPVLILSLLRQMSGPLAVSGRVHTH